MEIIQLPVDWIGRKIEGRQGDKLVAAASIQAKREKCVNQNGGSKDRVKGSKEEICE